MNQPVIQVQDLSFGYHGTPVLDDISFVVWEGEFVGVIGSNGAGKSTLFRLLLGELSPQRGEVSLFSCRLPAFHHWRSIGYVPQNGAVRTAQFPATAAEVVQANLYGEIGPFRLAGREHKMKVRQALEKVGIAHLEHRMIDRMSGGQFQRVLIARALVAGPRMLFLDEPTAGVDAKASEELYSLLGELNRQGMTILMVTHDMERSARYVHRALCIEDSSMVELNREALAHELAHKHTHPPRGEQQGQGDLW